MIFKLTLLRSNGQMVFIIPDAYNAAKYADKSHEFFLQVSRVKRIDFCSEIDLFDASVNNTILHFAKAAPNENHQPVRAKRWGKSKDEFEINEAFLTTNSQNLLGVSLFRNITGRAQSNHDKFSTLEKNLLHKCRDGYSC